MAGAGALDRRIHFQRFAEADNGLETVETWSNYGLPVWASRKDVSDAEKMAANWVEATVASRFVIRSNTFTRGLTAKDRLLCGGLVFDILGIKEIGRRDRLEVTAIARVDNG